MARIILIGGGSSSGKSYITNRVIKNIGEENVSHLTLDDYYKDQANKPMSERMLVNYDHPKAFDWQLMRSQILDLKNDKEIEKPIYDFTTHTRTNKTEIIRPKKLVIVEGIMALIDKDLRSMGDLKVYIKASPERRFLRRIVRDKKERGRELDNIVNQYFASVQPMYEEIIAPSSNYADMIINNDGVKNLAIEVLTCVLLNELRKANEGNQQEILDREEFTKDALDDAFSISK